MTTSWLNILLDVAMAASIPFCHTIKSRYVRIFPVTLSPHPRVPCPSSHVLREKVVILQLVQAPGGFLGKGGQGQAGFLRRTPTRPRIGLLGQARQFGLQAGAIL